MTGEWRQSYNENDAFGALLTTFAKDMVCLPPELLIAKLHVYRVFIPSLKLLHSHLTERKKSGVESNT